MPRLPRWVAVGALALAAVAGYEIGTRTALAPTAGPAIRVAVIPTSTPDLRPFSPPAATPVMTPAPTPAITATPKPASTPLKPAAPAAPRGQPVVYFVASGRVPAAVDAPEVAGQSGSDHTFDRLAALRTRRTGGPEGYLNIVGSMKARLNSVTFEGGGVVTVEYTAPGGDWGVEPDQVWLLVQQIVWTATEEQSVTRVRIVQNLGATAVIAGRRISGDFGRLDLEIVGASAS